MADRINLEVVTPERRVLSEEVDEVVLPSVEGSMGVLPGHAPLLALLDVGEMSFRIGGKRQYLAVSGGFAEVLRHSVSVLAKTCEQAEEIDVDRAARARKQAEEQLKSGVTGGDFRQMEVRLKRAMSRIKVHDRLRS